MKQFQRRTSMSADSQILEPDQHRPAPRQDGASPKWAAVVEDQLIPLPRQRLKAKDILAQAGASGTLLRDLDQPVDVPLPPDTEVDLAQGNVFRTLPGCEALP